MIDQYNAKLERVLHNESLFADFETILEERKAVMIAHNGLSDKQAEKICIQAENCHSVLLSL
jgi:hypothetical protein